MRKEIKTVALALMLAAAALLPVQAFQGGPEQAKFQMLAQLPFWAKAAISSDQTQANLAIEKLRAAGQYGIDALAAAHGSTLERANSDLEFQQSEEWKRLRDAFEKVGAQRDNWAAQLYWFRDLEHAKAAAKKENKPILSLRLLGHLDEELSCANSRFFRTALYPNARIQKILSENYILHWESVRPVPKVTIDFGDGRKIETTVTGNSIHYVLDSEGRILDALPGLYGPGAFERWLSSSNVLARDVASLDGAARTEFLVNFHKSRADQNAANWIEDLKRADANIGLRIAPLNGAGALVPQIQSSARMLANVPADPLAALPSELREALKTDAEQIQLPPRLGVLSPFLPTARTAAPLAVSKISVELRVLQSVTVALPRDRDVLKRTTSDEAWSKFAALYANEAKLDENSLRVLQTKTPRAQTVVATFEKSIAEDSVRNEYLRHTKIHQWLAQNPNVDLSAFNARVYSEIFLTPDSDPWLGLLPVEAYTGISNDGVVK